MIPVQMTLHIANMLLFGLALYLHMKGFMEVRRCKASPIILRLAKNLMLAGTAIGTLFLFLQLDWILSSHNQAVGDATSWAWLLFDYALSVYLLVTASLVRVFAKWKDRNKKYGRRREDRVIQ